MAALEAVRRDNPGDGCRSGSAWGTDAGGRTLLSASNLMEA